MRALSRLIVTGLIIVTVLWLKIQFDKLRQAFIRLDELSKGAGVFSSGGDGINTGPGHVDVSSNGPSSEVEDPFRLVFSAISDSLIAESIEDLATSKSALRDKRDKAVVVAKRTGENTNWISALLPNWEHEIYVVDDHHAPLHTAKNKGHEANAYLTYIIDNYYHLPDTIAFIHSHLSSWHNDQNVARALQLLNIDFVQSSGYVNLRCAKEPGCPDEVQPFRDRKKDKQNGGQDRSTELAFAAAWKQLFNITEVPKVIGVACCAQFAVSRDQVLKRPRGDYLWFHDWLMKTRLSDDVSGRILEYSWHYMMGKPPQYCPSVRQCYMDVYDQYNLG